jgi:hypothetical protein
VKSAWLASTLLATFIAVAPTQAHASVATLPHAPHAPAVQTTTTAYKAPAAPFRYTVKNGDTLSAISAKRLRDPARWPALWWVNRRRISNPNEITTGMQLSMPLKSLRGRWLQRRADKAIPKPRIVTTSYHAPAKAAAPDPPAPSGGGGPYGASPGSFEQCVITRESGGNPQAVNASSGAGGLFQFLPSTWADLGYSGLPENASVGLQYAAYAKLYAEDGMAPWDADGCPQQFGA